MAPLSNATHLALQIHIKHAIVRWNLYRILLLLLSFRLNQNFTPAITFYTTSLYCTTVNCLPCSKVVLQKIKLLFGILLYAQQMLCLTNHVKKKSRDRWLARADRHVRAAIKGSLEGLRDQLTASCRTVWS